MINSANAVDQMIAEWKSQGLSKADIVVKAAHACLGWPYVWGAVGAPCTVAKRKYYMGRSGISAGDIELVRKRCQQLNGSAGSCDGCTYYPNGEQTRINDCQGFAKQMFKAVGITLKGGGCTSMYRDDSNWAVKGDIRDMPAGAVCCVFKHISKTGKMDHIGIHVGGGKIIHCSVYVKEGGTMEKGWTHYAIPKGMEGGDEPVPITYPTLRKGSKGEYVTLLQTKLIQRGYSLEPFGADGSYGNVTVAAVRLFQRDNGLNDDGICGSKTWSAVMDGETTTYTVRIEHVSRSVAETIVTKYGGSMTAEEV